MSSPHDKFAIDGTKIHVHADKLAQWQSGDRSKLFPIYVEISPVGHCNHRCTFCAVDYIGYKVRQLDTDILKNNLSNMGMHGVRSVMFAGEGEPLLHPNMADIVRHTKKAGMDVAFTTNGVAITDKFLECLEDVSWIKVSLNAGDKESYGKIHQTKDSDWDRVWSNLHRTVLRSVGNGRRTTVGVQAVVLPDNIDNLKGLVKRAKETGLDYVVLKPYSQHKKSQTRTYEEVRYTERLEGLEQMAKEESGNGFNVICRTGAMRGWDEQKTKYPKCYATPFFWAYIMATGDVYGCSAYLLDERFNYGNISHEKFSDIWLGEKRRASIRYVEHELDIHECRLNCRMNKANEYLWQLEQDTGNPHANFI